MKTRLFLLSSALCCTLCSLGQTKILYVSFDVELKLDDPVTRLEVLAEAAPAFRAVYDMRPFTLRPAVMIPPQRLDEMEARVLETRGDAASVRKLRNLFRVELPGADDHALDFLGRQLKNLSIVNYYSLMPALPVRPPGDLPPTTPDYAAMQSYILSDPGVNMQYAWDLGYYGQHINIRDVEYGVNLNHEDLEDQNVYIQPGMTVNSLVTEDYSEHGTAAIGVLYSNYGDYGATGMVFQAEEVVLFPEYTEGMGYDRVNAVAQAVANSNPGDVIMYEMQTTGFTDYVPAEYDEPIWDLTRAAVDFGIVVVAAAGNGDQDLDSAPYSSYMARGNSGAILVGAGMSSTSHNRVSFSTYGSRVDVQGWGYDVFSTGYGDAYEIGGDFNQRYTWFSGTSSATPMVTSCVVNLQSYYYDLTGELLTGEEIRDILQQTGIPQGTAVDGNIGPLPNMEDAMLYIDDLAAIQGLKEKPADSFVAYPNPAKDQLKIKTAQKGEKNSFTITNSLGKTVLSGVLAENEIIDLSALESGVYFVTLSNAGSSSTQKIVKK
ncbi:MAG: S8 family peptidase [Bacteroidota bacterium]